MQTVEFCEELPIIANASGWKCEQDMLKSSDDGHFRFGTKCRVNCLPGYSLTTMNEIKRTVFGKQLKSLWYSNTKYAQCSEQGTWAPADYDIQFVCKPSGCHALSKPNYGTLFPEETCSSENIPLNTQCLILCSPGYYPKNGRLRTCSKDYRWSPEDSSSLCIRLPSSPRPYIHCPSDVNVDLMPGMASGYVKIPQPQANMDWHR